MSDEKLLAGRNAVIYGGGGSIGGAVAHAFAHHGAVVFLAGRNLAPLDRVAESIREAGGEVATAQVDALEEAAVDRHAADVVAEAGSIDVSLNAIGHPYAHGVPLADLSVKDFMAPIQVAAQSTFITTRAAARHMIPRRSGVILHFGGPGERSGPSRDYYLGGTQAPSTRSRRSAASSPPSSAPTASAWSPSPAAASPTPSRTSPPSPR
jgi:3-oxoacyl-[acyl-carrier protein] reductase